MRTQSIIKKCKGLGKLTQNPVTGQYFIQNRTTVISWSDCEGDAICLRTRKICDKDEIVSDYFAGYFCDTIKEAVESLKKF